MSKVILISTKKRDAKAKAVQIEECYKQRNNETLEYQRKNPFSYLEWYRAWFSGWLKQHGLSLFSFPSPVFHYRTLWRKSKEDFFTNWRGESKEKHREFLKKGKK